MAETVLLEKQIIDGFTDRFDGVYTVEIESDGFVLGEWYKITWDGVLYYCKCELGLTPTVGNRSYVFGDNEPGEPFCMMSGNNLVLILTRSTASSHTVAISLYRSPSGSNAKLNFRIKPIWRHIGSSKIKRIMRHTVELGEAKVKRVWEAFIFFDAITNVFMKLKSALISAPAGEMDADKKAQTKMNAPLVDQPSKAMEAKSNFVTSLSATLHAFMRAPAVTIANIFASIKAMMTSSVGSVFKHQTEMPMIHDSEMQSADTSILKHASNSGNEIKADGITAYSGVTSAEKESTSELKAAASANESATANMNGKAQNEHYSRVNTWYPPELVDGVLYIRQAYEATQTENGILEVK